MKYIVSINDNNYEVEVERGEARIVKTTQVIQVEVAPTAAPVQTTAVATPTVSQVAIGDGEPIKAPLPGVILAVKVSEGASVKRGEVLLILEAMKMENEIVAPRDGVVTQLVASKGASVNTGDVLVVIK